jgi:hypothetical protein
MRTGFEPGGVFDIVGPMVIFPPRNEPLQFRQALEGEYRDNLHRSPVQTFVDIEGSIVWTLEYLRYRLSTCGHMDAVQKVLDQIDGRGIAPECGGSTTAFPPRNEPFDFRANFLEAKYRDGLRRSSVASFVDVEGDIVWTTEYLRLRVAGCGNDQTTQLVLAQIRTGAVSPGCAVTPVPGTSTIPPAGSTLVIGSTYVVTNQSGIWPVPAGALLLRLEHISGQIAYNVQASGVRVAGGTIWANNLDDDIRFTGPANLTLEFSPVGTIRVTLLRQP